MFKKVVISFALLCTPAAAQGVYGALPPPDATFVRAADAGGASEMVAIGGDTVALPRGGVTDFVLLTAGNVDVGGAKFDLLAQKYYTLRVSSDGATVLVEDKAVLDRAKATIEFFNFSDVAALSLAAATGNPVIIENVALNDSGVREVNPLKVGFAAVVDGVVTATSEEVSLERGKVYSVFAVGELNKLSLTVVENAISSK